MTVSILVVDDEADVEALVRQKFRRQIRKGEYIFVFAGDGVEALEQLRENEDIDVVLSDINMPRMDGLTLLRRIGEGERQCKTIMISAYGDMENIRTAMNSGAFDFVTKPIDFNDLERTLEKTIEEHNLFLDMQSHREIAERERANLARYFPPNMVDTLANMDNPFARARRRDVSVLFADIIGFTSFSNQAEPGLVFEFLRDFHGRMEGVVFDAGGTLDKFMGDGLMATFGTPEPKGGEASNALACGREIQAAAGEVNEAHGLYGEAYLKVAVGIHHGPVLLGNIGGEHRLEFAAIGETVNIASRLEAMARPLAARIVVSDDFVAAVQAEDNRAADLLAPLADAGEQEIRGLAEPLRLWIEPR